MTNPGTASAKQLRLSLVPPEDEARVGSRREDAPVCLPNLLELAIACAQQFLREGYDWVVDLDLERFFDRVVHEVLMTRVKRQVADPRVLKLIDRYLKSGVMIGVMLEPTEEGVPQGGPLSPPLANLLLDDLNRELEKRGHRFVRYADDVSIYVRSRRAGERVLASVKSFLENA